MVVLSSCIHRTGKIDEKHIEHLAEDFMKDKVIPQMKDPKPYEIVNAKVVKTSVANMIDDYRYSYDHLSFNHEDSVENKRLLDSVSKVSANPDSILNVTVDVAYKTRYQRGDIVTDSIKLGYNVKEDKICYWPF